MFSLKEKSNFNTLKQYFDKNKNIPMDDWLTVDTIFPRPGKQGIVGLMKSKDNDYLYLFKISQYINYLTEHELEVMTGLNSLSEYCPHFCRVFGNIKCKINPDCKKTENPFEKKSRYLIEKNVLIMEYLKKSHKFFNYIKASHIDERILYSTIKQTLLAISIAQQKKRFSHYDLHSNNIMMKKCDKDLVFLYVLDEENQFCVPTHGICPILIDFGFSFINNMNNNYLWPSLGHTDVGFMSDRFDPITDMKLFLVTVSGEIHDHRKTKNSKKLLNIVKNNFNNLKLDWNSGWDKIFRKSASDYVLKVLEKYNKKSPLFTNCDNYCIDILQSLIIGKDNKIIYSKLESYINNKYSNNICYGYMNNNDNINVNLTGSIFTKPIIDYYEKHRIYLLLQESGIHIRSYSLEINGIKKYIKTILATSLGIKTITIHQPILKNITTSHKHIEKEISWESILIKTNKNFNNTILTDKVSTDLLVDLEHFMNNEDYYNKKGIPYKRGYLLSGPPGTGKTSILKAIASHYSMDMYVINLGDINDEQDIINIFRGTQNNGYHIVCLEDIDRCQFIVNKYNDSKDISLLRTLINELDGVIETSKRLTFLTVNDKEIVERHSALCRPGRIDKIIDLDYCDAIQTSKLYNHFTETKEYLELDSNSFNYKITPAQVVKYILNNPTIGTEQFKKELNSISNISVKEDLFTTGRKLRKRQKRTKLNRTKIIFNRNKKLLLKLPSIIQKQEEYIKTQSEKEIQKRKTKKRRKIT